MKIEVGKYYKTRDGRKVGPMMHSGFSNWPWIFVEGDCLLAWDHDGKPVHHAKADRLTAEWTDTPDETPKLWRDMTPEEKGALLLAHHEGKVIEVGDGSGWYKIVKPEWFDHISYRVQPANPVVETVTLAGRVGVGSEWSFGTGEEWPFDSHRITFNLIDGKPDLSSIRMEATE